jgi:hypothetical protein
MLLQGRNDQPLIAMVSDFSRIDSSLVEKVANLLGSKLENYRIEVYDANRLPSSFSPDVILIPFKMIGTRPSINPEESEVFEAMKSYTNNVMILLLDITPGDKQARNEFVLNISEYGGFGLGTPSQAAFSPRFFIDRGNSIMDDPRNNPQNFLNLTKLRNYLKQFVGSGSTVYEQPRQPTTIPQRQPEPSYTPPRYEKPPAQQAMQDHEKQIAELRQQVVVQRMEIEKYKKKSKDQKAKISMLESRLQQSGGSVAQEKLTIAQQKQEIQELKQDLDRTMVSHTKLRDKLAKIIQMASSD